jgi:hypothetical protein
LDVPSATGTFLAAGRLEVGSALLATPVVACPNAPFNPHKYENLGKPQQCLLSLDECYRSSPLYFCFPRLMKLMHISFSSKPGLSHQDLSSLYDCLEWKLCNSAALKSDELCTPKKRPHVYIFHWGKLVKDFISKGQISSVLGRPIPY